MADSSAERWIEDVWSDCLSRVEKTRRRIGVSFPHISRNGRYDDNPIGWWTNGFWPGIMWLIYRETADPEYRHIAEGCESRLDENLYGYDDLDHDVGFLWLLSAVADYRITGNDASRRRGMLAASVLASRFNLKGRYIRAWNHRGPGWTIIDSMMNIPLLSWAAEMSGDDRFRHIAEAHADTVLDHFVRSDGSVHHIVEFDVDTGDVLRAHGGQGYGEGSSWTRGQAWAIYGFMRAYRNLSHRRYLNSSVQIGEYFLSSLPEDKVPPCDFRSPAEGVGIKDATAGAIAAGALVELSSILEEGDEGRFRQGALALLRGLWENCAGRDGEEEALITMGSLSYHEADGRNVPMIYGDYFFLEALSKLRGEKRSFW